MRRPSLAPSPTRWPRHLAGLGLLLTLLALALAPVADEADWPLLLLGYIAPLALPPLALATVLLLWPWPRRRGLAWLLVGLAGFLLALAAIPTPTVLPADRTGTLTVVTFNLGNGLVEPARLAEMLRHWDADLVALQEVTAATAEALPGLLADRYPYRALYGQGIPGTGLLSRYPILAAEQVELAPGRPDLLARVEIDGREVTVIVAHPEPPRLHRTGIHFNQATRAQFDRLIALAASGQPTLLLGDLNMTDRHPTYRRLVAAGLTDAFAAAGSGLGFTFPARLGPLPALPIMRIDYIWYSAHVEAQAAWCGPSLGSDHLPVLARLRWATVT